MNKLILTGLLSLAALTSIKADDCITNIHIHCNSPWSFTVGHTEGFDGSCWNAAISYTDLTCPELLANGGGNPRPCLYQAHGTFIHFTYGGTNCPPSAQDVAVVTYTCNTAVICSVGQGGPMSCQPGSSFTITMDAGVTDFIAFIVPGFSKCCSATWCELSGSRTTCVPRLPGGGD